MLKLSISEKSGAEGWVWAANRYVNGSAWVEPYSHPSLEHLAASDGQETFICVRERSVADAASSASGIKMLASSDYKKLLEDMLCWPLDFTLVRVSGARVSVQAGAWGSAPLYLTAVNGTVHGSWRLGEVKSHIPSGVLVDREVARILTLRHRYSSETVFGGIHRLTERAKATLKRNELSVEYPQAALHALPRRLRPDADVLAYYGKFLADAVNARYYQPNEVVIELSGGLDSANVAMAFAELYPGCGSSYALMIGGDSGEQQRRRRQIVIDRCKFSDIQLNLLDHLPFDFGASEEWHALSPYDDPYIGAFKSLLAHARRAGTRVAMTGMGGDELVAPYATEVDIPAGVAELRLPLPSWLGRRTLQAFDEVDQGIAPGAIAAESSLLASACRAPAFLSAGIWPVSPMMSPNLIRFAESLPLGWRQDKALHCKRLAGLGFPADWIRPPLQENFNHIMRLALQKNGPGLVKRLAASSILADLGYIKPDVLIADFRCMDWGDDRTISALYAVLHLERAAL